MLSNVSLYGREPMLISRRHGPAGGDQRVESSDYRLSLEALSRGGYQSLQMTLQWVWQGTTYSNVLKLGLLSFAVTVVWSAQGHVLRIPQDSPMELCYQMYLLALVSLC